MTEFQPVPGVRYLIQVRNENEKREALYAPTRQYAEYHWLSLSTQDRPGEWLLVHNEDIEIISEVYNPHPPTRTEWRVVGLNNSSGPNSSEPMSTRAAAECALTMYQWAKRIEIRQVSEWQEITGNA